ncbi:MAG: hypothetical protein GAK31_02162 [Stenotrophomonas maltophilia]|uniref:HDOD domain-containing protein n=1 Tax=Stenotrophomonas maltophilia TaxID=40324 RepID=A0A7V8JLA4_STEMA|nr:MAG: hypothetical protein GAK31_02162 [Stenotrophomonas maltophilia]
MRILLVGDAASLPAELIEFIADLGEDWQPLTAADGSTAMNAVSAHGVDAVIVCPHLPDLNATTLLGQIRTLRPETIRIALIDAQQGSRPPPARLIGVAHRFLPLPLAPEVLLEALTSLEELRELLDSPRLRDAIGRIEKLPSPPHLYLSPTQALEHDDDTDNADVARLVAADPAIAAKVLQLSNSAFFSQGRTISDLRAAVTRLGLSTLRDLVLASEVFSAPTLSAAERNSLQQRALLASRLAAKLLPESSAELGPPLRCWPISACCCPACATSAANRHWPATCAQAMPKPVPTCWACGGCRWRSSKRWPSTCSRSAPTRAASG